MQTQNYPRRLEGKLEVNYEVCTNQFDLVLLDFYRLFNLMLVVKTSCKDAVVVKNIDQFVSFSLKRITPAGNQIKSKIKWTHYCLCFLTSYERVLGFLLNKKALECGAEREACVLRVPFLNSVA